jgi:hypothetical protein
MYWSLVIDLIGTASFVNLVVRRCTAKYNASVRTGMSTVKPARVGAKRFTAA